MNSQIKQLESQIEEAKDYIKWLKQNGEVEQIDKYEEELEFLYCKLDDLKGGDNNE